MLPVWPCVGRGLPSQAGRPACWCALTAPFHPYRTASHWTTPSGGLFSVALSLVLRPVGVTHRPVLRRPDFPPAEPLQTQPATARSSPLTAFVYSTRGSRSSEVKVITGRKPHSIRPTYYNTSRLSAVIAEGGRSEGTDQMMAGRSKWSPWLIGMLISFSFWGAALIGFYATDAVPLLFGLFAWPVANFGWLAVWGDSGPPFPWLSSLAFHIPCTLLIYSVLGAIIGWLLAWRNSKSLSNS
jgi:hypothetical protein